MFSNEHNEQYIIKQLEKMESKKGFLRKSNILKYCLYRFNKSCVFFITKKQYKQVKREMRIFRMKEILKEVLFETYKKNIPTAEYMTF